MAAPRTIRMGDTGAEVTLLQQKLGLPLAQFGTFDAYTKQRVQAFQSARGLQPDGIVGPLTWAALGVTNVTAPSSPPSLWDYFPQIGAAGGSTTTAPPASGFPAGSRVRFTGNATTILGTRSLVVLQSALDRIGAALQRRGYGNVTTNSNYSEVVVEATLAVGKANEAACVADFVSAGSEAGVPLGNARAEIVSGVSPLGDPLADLGKMFGLGTAGALIVLIIIIIILGRS